MKRSGVSFSTRRRAPHTCAGSKQVLGLALGPSNHQADAWFRSGQIETRHRRRNAAGDGAWPVPDSDCELCDSARTRGYGCRVQTRSRSCATRGPSQPLGLVSLRSGLRLDVVGDGRTAGATGGVGAPDEREHVKEHHSDSKAAHRTEHFGSQGGAPHVWQVVLERKPLAGCRRLNKLRFQSNVRGLGRPRTKEIQSGRRDSNPRRRPWQGRTLPLSYSRGRRGGVVLD